jgi:replication factor C subunit 1
MNNPKRCTFYRRSLFCSHGKDLEEGPFDSISKLFGSQYDRMNISERIDAYFVDSSLVPLMVHENYQRCRPSGGRRLSEASNPSALQLVAAAADALSLSDKVDSLIRGSNQEWSLAPLHGFMSTVLPCYYVHGSLSGQIAFPTWFGQNSKATKSQRLLREVSQHTFITLKSTITDVRYVYCDYLVNGVLVPMLNGNVDCAISFMDQLHLCREDVDSLIELSGKQDYWTKIPSTAKSAFTRKYNSVPHKLPYAVGAAVGKAIRVADLDTGLEDDGEEGVEGKEEVEDEESIEADKMIKEKKPKAVKRK